MNRTICSTDTCTTMQDPSQGSPSLSSGQNNDKTRAPPRLHNTKKQGTTAFVPVLVPKSQVTDKDVIVGKSRSATHSAGNIRFRQFLIPYCRLYKAIGQGAHPAKMQISKDILKDLGGRFLKSHPSGDYQTISPSIARDKIINRLAHEVSGRNTTLPEDPRLCRKLEEESLSKYRTLLSREQIETLKSIQSIPIKESSVGKSNLKLSSRKNKSATTGFEEQRKKKKTKTMPFSPSKKINRQSTRPNTMNESFTNNACGKNTPSSAKKKNPSSSKPSCRKETSSILSVRKNTRLAIYWPDDNAFYTAVVKNLLHKTDERGTAHTDENQSTSSDHGHGLVCHVRYDFDGTEEHLNLNEHTFHILRDSLDTFSQTGCSVPTVNGHLHVLAKPPAIIRTARNDSMMMGENALPSVSTYQSNNSTSAISRTDGRRQSLGQRGGEQLTGLPCHPAQQGNAVESTVGQIVKLNTIGTTHQVAGHRTFMTRLTAPSAK